jgi:hypothetical protein
VVLLSGVTCNVFWLQCGDFNSYIWQRRASSKGALEFGQDRKISIETADCPEHIVTANRLEQRCRIRLSVSEAKVKSPSFKEITVWRNRSTHAQARMLNAFACCLRRQNESLNLIVSMHIMRATSSCSSHLVIGPFPNVAIKVPMVATAPDM